MSYSHSPALRQLKILPITKISQIYSEDLPVHRNDFNSSDGLFRDRLKLLPKTMSKVVKIAARQKNNRSSTKNLNLSQKISENFPVLDTDSNVKNIKIEAYLLEKLKNEPDFEKKLDIVSSTAAKLCDVDRNFHIFYNVIKHFLIEYKEHLIKQHERFQELEEIEKNHELLKDTYSKLLENFTDFKKENSLLKIEVEKLKEKNGQMVFKIKRNAAFLTKLQAKGLPIEQIYKETYGLAAQKSKSLKKIEILKEKAEERPNSIPMKKTPKNIPKLVFAQSPNEGYQDEFMAKFNEFSESWRNQIINDHHCSDTINS